MLKKVLFPVIAIFLAYRTYELLNMLWFLELSKISWLIKILLPVLLNLFITGFFAFFGFAYKTSRVLNENYYYVNNPKFIAKLYKVLKVEYFKKFLLLAFWGKKKNRQKYFDGTKLGLENFDYQTKQSEFGHLAALIIIQMVVFLMLYKGHYTIAFFTTLLNFISNFYPVILQRNHRMNIMRIRNILDKKTTT
jgi:hypothetical protein